MHRRSVLIRTSARDNNKLTQLGPESRDPDALQTCMKWRNPMTFTTLSKLLLVTCGVLTVLSSTYSAIRAPPVPNPVLYLTGNEMFETGGKKFIRYRYDVLNKSDYPPEMFAASPNLPPCGKNTKASRTWVDFILKAESASTGFVRSASRQISTVSGSRLR